MIEETGTVVELDGEHIWVETRSRSACSHCGVGGDNGSCGTSVVAKLFGVRRNRLRLYNSLNAHPGQQVVVGIPDKVLVAVSLRAYLLPLLSMLGMTALAASLDMGQVMQGFMALSGLFIGLALIGRASNTGKAQARYAPQLLRLAGVTGMAIDTTALTRSRT